jgi:hypothetical protein
MFHAGHMPRLAFGRVESERRGPGLWQVTFEVRNSRLIPTRTGRARDKSIGQPDLLTARAGGGAAVVATGRLRSWWDEEMRLDPDADPARVLVPEGIPGQGERTFRMLVRGDAGDTITLTYEAEKAKTIQTSVTLGE